MAIYDYKVLDRKGNEVSMADFKGKVLLIVNTATGCGFTPQYKGLENLWQKYHEKWLEILDFPCDQFGHQAPGDDTKDNISINQFIISAVAEKISSLETQNYLEERAERCSRDKFMAVLSKAPDVEPADNNR